MVIFFKKWLYSASRLSSSHLFTVSPFHKNKANEFWANVFNLLWTFWFRLQNHFQSALFYCSACNTESVPNTVFCAKYSNSIWKNKCILLFIMILSYALFELTCVEILMSDEIWIAAQTGPWLCVVLFHNALIASQKASVFSLAMRLQSVSFCRKTTIVSI